MSIVFAILKIIGIVLLALFLLVLFLLLLLLFAPVRYRVKLVSQGAMPNVEASASYLFPLLHFRFSYREKEGANGHLRLLWFSFPKEEKQEKEDKPKKQHSKPTEKAQMRQPPEQAPAPAKKEQAPKKQPVGSFSEEDEEEDEELYDFDFSDEMEQIPTLPASPIKREIKKEKKRKKTEPNIHLISWIRHLFHRIKEAVLRLYDRIKHFQQEWAQTTDKVKRLKQLYDAELTKLAIKGVKKEVFYVLKKERPQKIRGFIRFGCSDPAQTGELLGAASMFYAYFGSSLKLYPDFNEACLSVNILIKGRLRLIYPVVAVIKLFFNRALKKTIKRYKHITGGN